MTLTAHVQCGLVAWGLATCISTCISTAAPASNGRRIDPFELTDIDGPSISVAPSTDSALTVVCFLGTECPLAKLYGPRLAALAIEFQSQRVRFVGVNSNQQDSLEEVRKYVEELEIGFAFGKDGGNRVADLFTAERTPEVFVLDQDLEIRYHGRIDDQYTPGISRSAASRQDLRVAVEELLDGKPVTVAETEATGCFIGRVHKAAESSDVTYCDQVSRVLQRHCTECHRADKIGPFSLTDYDEAIGWAETMLEVIDNGRMPPWHANPEHGDFTNARVMPDEDKQLLHRWVENGMPYGDKEQLLAPQTYTPGWQLDRHPDLILPMSREEFVVPADGTVEYQYFVVDPNFEEDCWVTGTQVLPGNRSVVHHSIVFIRPPDGSGFRGIGWLGGYVPGQLTRSMPEGLGIRIPAGSKLVFQQHYTPTGSEQLDLTHVGLTFGDESSITHEVYSLVDVEQEFEIPPHDDHHVVSSTSNRFPREAQLLAISPHMHLRGRAFRLVAQRPDESNILLDVPNYDFNWQHTYQLTTPLSLDSIDGVEFEATFDNSSKNPSNPDPKQWVTWGDQTWEEMAVVFLTISVPRAAEVEEPSEEPTAEVTGPPSEPLSDDDISTEIRQRMSAEADRLLARFDNNGDGEITRYETPVVFRKFSFRQMDEDGDDCLTRAEIEKAARQHVQ